MNHFLQVVLSDLNIAANKIAFFAKLWHFVNQRAKLDLRSTKPISYFISNFVRINFPCPKFTMGNSFCCVQSIVLPLYHALTQAHTHTHTHTRTHTHTQTHTHTHTHTTYIFLLLNHVLCLLFLCVCLPKRVGLEGRRRQVCSIKKIVGMAHRHQS